MKSTWDNFRKERDFHRMHHKRVMQEKNKLIVDMKRLKTHYDTYEPTMKELRSVTGRSVVKWDDEHVCPKQTKVRVSNERKDADAIGERSHGCSCSWLRRSSEG